MHSAANLTTHLKNIIRNIAIVWSKVKHWCGIFTDNGVFAPDMVFVDLLMPHAAYIVWHQHITFHTDYLAKDCKSLSLYVSVSSILQTQTGCSTTFTHYYKNDFKRGTTMAMGLINGFCHFDSIDSHSL